MLPTACKAQNAVPVSAAQTELTSQASAPKLVVGIVVDQMRYEYLQRYAEHFTEGGFKRLMREGFINHNTHYNYIPTFTGPGHASIYAGTTPEVHGIVANYWYDRSGEVSVNCVGDPDVKAVGTNDEVGNASPHRLLSTTITDELELATGRQAKVVGVSIKDRGAILPAGHLADGAYWYDYSSGKFITSTFYRESLPDWVQDFNNSSLTKELLNSSWNTLLPIENYTASGPDNTPYEEVFKGKKTPTFPYDLAALQEENGGYGMLPKTPFGNTLVAKMAIAALEGEQLGEDEVTDFLAVSFSSTDIIGHDFGLRSIELQDTYLRLDRELAELLAALDEKVGKDNYLVFLTADHAAVDVPNFNLDNKLPGGYIDTYALKDELNQKLEAVYGIGQIVVDGGNNQFYFNRELLAEKGLELEAVQNRVASWLRGMPGIANAYTATQLATQAYTEGAAKMLQRGFSWKRSGDVLMVYDPGFMYKMDYGTTHGSGYAYDTHVPLLWYGWQIPQGESYQKQVITDIVPTLSFMLGINDPSGVTGQPIIELLQDIKSEPQRKQQNTKGQDTSRVGSEANQQNQ